MSGALLLCCRQLMAVTSAPASNADVGAQPSPLWKPNSLQKSGPMSDI